MIELSGQHELQLMIKREGDEKQELLGVHYFTDIYVGKMPEIMNSGYEAFVLDLGVDYDTVREEFLRCDRKIVVGSISPWKISAYEHFLKDVIALENYGSWEFLVLFANLLDKKSIQKRYGVHMLSVPWIGNPFCLDHKDMVFLQKII